MAWRWRLATGVALVLALAGAFLLVTHDPSARFHTDPTSSDEHYGAGAFLLALAVLLLAWARFERRSQPQQDPPSDDDQHS
jgi:drug/metabolite transporter (DMT)-like permease